MNRYISSGSIPFVRATYYRTLFLIILFGIFFHSVGVSAPIAHTDRIHGVVSDSVTGLPLPYVSFYIEGTTLGAMSNEQGEFTLINNSSKNMLVGSSLGYEEVRIPLTPDSYNQLLQIVLSPQAYAVDEVVVTPTREDYTNRDNPAVALVRRLIKQREEHAPEEHDYYQYEKYEKMVFALNDFSPQQREQWLFKKFQFIFAHVDSSEVSGKPILPVSVKEQISNGYYRRSPHRKKVVVTGVKRDGIDEQMNQESLQTFYNEVLREVDIYNNDIPLFLTRFVSPLATIAPNFYKYYLLDTVTIDNSPYVDLGFVPRNSQSTGFTGHLYVAADSTLFIRKVQLNLPRNISLNYIENLTITQEFEQMPDGTRLLTVNDVVAEFEIVPNTQGLYVRNIATYKDYRFTPPSEEESQLLEEEGSVILTDDAEVKPKAFWDDKRHLPLKPKEGGVSKMLEELRKVKLYYYSEKVIGALISGYVETSPKDSKFDFGPMNTLIGGNTLEGIRLRVGGMTTANLHPQLFARGYVAYGTRDNRLKYSGELEYSFNKKRYHAKEFPINSVKLSHSYDINQLGQHYLYTNKDNIFVALKRQADTQNTYLRNTSLAYQREYKGGFSYLLESNYKTEYATRWVPFVGGDGTMHDHYNQATATLSLRYAAGEKFYETKTGRHPINKDTPIFTLSHTAGIKGFLGSDYTLHHTEVGVQKRFWFSAFGYSTLFLRAGKVWTENPYPLLIIPNANLSYTIQYESYPLMNAMEFLNDEYLSWDLSYNMNGLLLNRIPLVKYLKIREVVSFRGLWGSLRDENNPTHNPQLYTLPATTHLMSNTPYMEAGVGLENIFSILRVDYVWRLTYRNLPHINRSGLRIALTFGF